MFDGMFAGDNLIVASATGTFADKNAGTDKIVLIANLVLGGDDAHNYTLVNATATTTANVLRALLTLLALGDDVNVTVDVGVSDAGVVVVTIISDASGEYDEICCSIAFSARYLKLQNRL